VGHLPDGRTWGAFNAVAIDNDGESVWWRPLRRQSGDPPEALRSRTTCAGSTVAPVLKLDSSGNVMQSFGADMFVFPHKIHVDWEGNVWVVDARSANERERKKHPDAKAKGHTVVKFSPQGKVLLTIGTPGLAGNPPEALTEPTSVVVAPGGDIFIAEGHSGQAANSPPDTVARLQVHQGWQVREIVRQAGSGPAEFRTPHDITMDSQGRLLVADR
jgi:DNA-binding beta-propeller fold protein YncE